MSRKPRREHGRVRRNVTLRHDGGYGLRLALDHRRERVRNLCGGLDEFPVAPLIAADQQRGVVRVESRVLEDAPACEIARRDSLNRCLTHLLFWIVAAQRYREHFIIGIIRGRAKVTQSSLPLIARKP